MRTINTPDKLGRVLSLTVATILVLLPFHAFFTTWVASNTGHFDLVRVWKEIALLAFTPAVVLLVVKNRVLASWLVNSWIVRLVAAYLVLCLVDGVWALKDHKVNDHALAYGLIIDLRFVLFFIFCLIVAASDDFLKRYWHKILLIPGLMVIGFGLCQKFLLPSDFLRHFGYGKGTIAIYQTVDSNLDYRRIQSTLRGANPLGAYLVLVLPAIMMVLRKHRNLRFLSLTGGVVVLFYSYSRSAMLGVIAAFLTLMSLTKNNFWSRQRAILAGAVLVAILITGLWFVEHNRSVQDTLLHTSDSSTSSVSSNDARLTALKNGIDDIVHEPLGEGVGTAGPASFRNRRPRISENYILQIGQEMGVAGMVLFIAINCLVVYQLWLRRQETLNKVLIASFVGLTIVNMLSHAWADDTISYLWWGLAGIACAPVILGRRHKQHGKKHQAART